jgi:oxygen-independent coproporphyrinogen-3 oxidase
LSKQAEKRGVKDKKNQIESPPGPSPLMSPKSPRLAFGGDAATVTADRYWQAIRDWAAISGIDDGVPIYLHVPFCPVRCGRCTRIAEITHSIPAIDNYLDLLEREMAIVTSEIGKGREVSQLYIGGGTPNFLTNNQLIRLTESIEKHFAIGANSERTIEINPYRASYNQLQLLRGLGYTNLQLELREILRGDMAGIDRSCSPDLLADVFGNARMLGFKTITLDITYGTVKRLPEDVLSELECLLDLAPDRILCHAAQSSFAQDANEVVNTSHQLTHAQKLSLFVSMLAVFEARGYEWVGVSGFAKPEDPWCAAQREGRLFRNWIGYTTERNFSVLGFGLGAVSELPGLIAQNFDDLRAWSARVSEGLPPVAKGIELSELKRREREMLGVLSANLNAEAPQVMDSTILEDLKQSGVVEAVDGRVFLTAFGRAFFSQVHDWDRNHRLIAS